MVVSGMTDTQIRKCHERLERFLVDLLEPVGRSERRHWGAVYVRGLLLDGERKSVEPMASRLPDGNVQAMQQFIGQSPWDWPPIWERLARRMTAELEPESAWAIDDTGFPKQGDHSVGVERQYSGTLGKTGNCQVAVSLHHVGAQGSAALNWRLYLPESWIGDQERRAEAGIPKEVEFQKKWQLALEMIDEVRGWGLTDRIVVADAGFGDGTEFRGALEARKLSYAVGVSSQVGVWGKPPKIHIPEYSGRGQPATRYQYGKQRPTSVRDVALHAKGWKKIRWREGSKGWLESWFLAVRVQPSHGFVDGEPPQRGLATGAMAGRRKGAHQIFSLRSAAQHHIAPFGCWRSSQNVGIWTLRRPASFPGVPSTARKPVKRVAPTILMTANGTLGAVGRLSLGRGCDRSRTLMRHAGLALASPVGMLALAVMLPACRGGLVSAA